MWLNSVRSLKDSKPLSPIELLVLTQISEESLNASELVNRLNESSLMWNAAPGTLYPILHRLEKRGLLNKSGSRGTDFSRSQLGDQLLNHSLTALKAQMKETNNYYVTIISALLGMKNAPMGIHEFMDEVVDATKHLLKQVTELKERSKSIVDKSVKVDIDFD